MGILKNIGIRVRNYLGGFGVSLSSRDFHSNYQYWQQNSIYLDNIFNKIANDVAMMEFEHIKIEKVEGKPNKITKLEYSSLDSVLSFSPNDYETPTVFWSNVIRTTIREQIAVVVPTYVNGEIASIDLVDGVNEIKDHRLNITIKENTFDVDINSVWIFENPKLSITSGLNNIAKLIDENLKAMSYKISQQGNSLKGFLKVPTATNDAEMRKKAEKRVSDIISMAKDSGIGYLDKNEDFKELNNQYNTVSPEELEFLKLQLYQSFGLNEKLFTCDYSESQYRAYFISVLSLYQKVIKEEINRKHFSKTARTQGHRLIVRYNLFSISSLKDLKDFLFDMKYTGNLTSNEAREILGYGGYEGGDVYETNKNAVQINRGN